jgi:hypothetical protein
LQGVVDALKEGPEREVEELADQCEILDAARMELVEGEAQ